MVDKAHKIEARVCFGEKAKKWQVSLGNGPIGWIGVVGNFSHIWEELELRAYIPYNGNAVVFMCSLFVEKRT